MSDSESQHNPGPFLTAALICDRVLQESDGTLSVIRLIDEITLADGAATALDVALLVCLKGGAPGATHQVRVVARLPEGGGAHEVGSHSLELGSLQPDGVPGANLVVQLKLALERAGVYWFDVEMDGRRLTATPLQVAADVS